MKLDTPGRPRKKRGFPTLEKGGVFVRRGELPRRPDYGCSPYSHGSVLLPSGFGQNFPSAQVSHTGIASP